MRYFARIAGNVYRKRKRKVREDRSPIGTQFLDLANDFLSVKEVQPGAF